MGFTINHSLNHLFKLTKIAIHWEEVIPMELNINPYNFSEEKNNLDFLLDFNKSY